MALPSHKSPKNMIHCISQMINHMVNGHTKKDPLNHKQKNITLIISVNIRSKFTHEHMKYKPLENISRELTNVEIYLSLSFRQEEIPPDHI